MTLYAYCNSSLQDHSLNVLKHFEQTFIERGDTRVLCRKIILSCGNHTSRNPDKGESELVDTCINLTRLGVVLHDIGKGTLLYQDPGLHVTANGECRASYPFHEVFSSIIIYRLVKRYLVKYVKVRQLLIIPVVIALYHHYTMERLNPSKIIEYVYKRFRGKVVLHPELEKTIIELSSRILKDMGIELGNNIIRKRKILDPIKTSDIQAVFKHIGEKYITDKRVLLLAMGLVGQAAIIDYIVAGFERKGSSRYLENLCREAGWLCGSIEV